MGKKTDRKSTFSPQNPLTFGGVWSAFSSSAAAGMQQCHRDSHIRHGHEDGGKTEEDREEDQIVGNLQFVVVIHLTTRVKVHPVESAKLHLPTGEEHRGGREECQEPADDRHLERVRYGLPSSKRLNNSTERQQKSHFAATQTYYPFQQAVFYFVSKT